MSFGTHREELRTLCQVQQGLRVRVGCSSSLREHDALACNGNKPTGRNEFLYINFQHARGCVIEQHTATSGASVVTNDYACNTPNDRSEL